MKKHFDGTKYIPVGWDWENLRFSILMGHLTSVLPLLYFVVQYLQARSELFVDQIVDGKWVVVPRPGAVMVPFAGLIRGIPLMGFWIFFLLMGYQVARHYRYHTRDSMSVYLMRRLPDRWEYHRRCWTVPVLSSLVELVLLAGMLFLCGLLYRGCTPAECLL